MRRKIIRLEESERIIAVVPEYCSGPGWSNQPIWVHIKNGDRVRTECIQPEEQTAELLTLFSVGAVIHDQLLKAIPTQKRDRDAKQMVSEQIDGALHVEIENDRLTIYEYKQTLGTYVKVLVFGYSPLKFANKSEFYDFWKTLTW